VTGQTLKLSAHESVVVRESTPDVFEVEVTYEAGGKPPPPHFHPSQDEHFQVVEGQLRARVDGRKWLLKPGETLSVERGAHHQLWNGGDTPARVVWRTTPRLRTEDWFAELDALQRVGRAGRNGMPGPLSLAPLVTEYRDVFRPAIKPRPLVRAGLVVLAFAGRLTGHRAKYA
jgi:quercetin dioxygenase-like cupin family protein